MSDQAQGWNTAYEEAHKAHVARHPDSQWAYAVLHRYGWKYLPRTSVVFSMNQSGGPALSKKQQDKLIRHIPGFPTLVSSTPDGGSTWHLDIRYTWKSVERTINLGKYRGAAGHPQPQGLTLATEAAEALLKLNQR